MTDATEVKSDAATEAGATEAGKPEANSSTDTSKTSPVIPVMLTAEQVATALPPADASSADVAAVPSSTAPAADPNAAAGAAPSATTAEPVPTAGSDSGTSGIVANSPAEPLTFEQLVEQRFMKLERALVQLPHSIHTVMSEGSHEVEEFAEKVLKHLFSRI